MGSKKTPLRAAVSARKVRGIAFLRIFQAPPVTCAIDQARTMLYPIRLESRNRSTASLFCIALPVASPERPCLEPGRVAEPCLDREREGRQHKDK